MARSKRGRRGFGKLSESSAAAFAGMVLPLGSGPAWAGPPNPTPSDNMGNTAGGALALSNNSTGIYNTAFGQGALYNNAVGNYNTAVGVNALLTNTMGQYNTAVGLSALLYNTASGNTATGLEEY